MLIKLRKIINPSRAAGYYLNKNRQGTVHCCLSVLVVLPVQFSNLFIMDLQRLANIVAYYQALMLGSEASKLQGEKHSNYRHKNRFCNFKKWEEK